MRSNSDIVQGAGIFADVHILKRYQDAGLKNREIAQYVGKSETYVSRMLQLTELPDEVKKVIQRKSVTSLELMLVINEQYRKYGQEFLDELNNIDEIRRSKLREIAKMLKKRRFTLNPFSETKNTGKATGLEVSQNIATQFGKNSGYINLIISLAQTPHELQDFLIERNLPSIRTLAQCSVLYRQYGEVFLNNLKVEELNEKKLNEIISTFRKRISYMKLLNDAKAIKIMADSGLNYSKIATRLNKSVSYVYSMMSVNKAPKELLNFLIQKNVKSAYVIADCNALYRKYDKEFLEELKKTKEININTLNKIDAVLKERHPTEDPFVIAKTIKDLADSGVPRKDIAARLNKSVSYVYCMKSLNQTPKKLLDFLIQKGINSVREKTKCSVLYRKYSKEFFEELKKTKEIDLDTLNKIEAVLKERHPTVDPFVTAKTIKDLADSGVPHKDIAARLNKSVNYVYFMKSLAQTPKKLLDFLIQRNVKSTSVIAKCSVLYQKYGKEFLEELKTKEIDLKTLSKIDAVLKERHPTEDPFVIAKTIKDLADSGVPDKDIAARLNKSVSYVICMKSLNQTPQDLKDYFVQKKIRSWYAMVRFQGLYRKYGREFLKELKETEKINERSLRRIAYTLNNRRITAMSEFTKELDHAKEPA